MEIRLSRRTKTFLSQLCVEHILNLKNCFVVKSYLFYQCQYAFRHNLVKGGLCIPNGHSQIKEDNNTSAIPDRISLYIYMGELMNWLCQCYRYGCDFTQWKHHTFRSWWRHQMKTFSALMVLFAGNSLVTGEFPTQRPHWRSIGVFFDLRLKKRLTKQSRGWWFETPSCSIWRHCNGLHIHSSTIN